MRLGLALGRRVRTQTVVVLWWQTESKIATEFVQEPNDFALRERAETHPFILAGAP
jgi:hypothetical protein